MKNKQTKTSVLVVDDMPINIKILTELLCADYQVKAATNGVDAFTIAKSFPQPDLILLDIMMPELDGYDVIHRLKTNPKTESIPVIFVTAMNKVDDECLGFGLGAVDYITKPFNPALVLARVKMHLAMYNYNRRLEEKVKVAKGFQLPSNEFSLICSCFNAAKVSVHVPRFKVLTQCLQQKHKETGNQFLLSSA